MRKSTPTLTAAGVLLTVLAIPLLLSACRKPIEWPPDIDRELERSEILGEWKLDETTKQLLVREGVANDVVQAFALRIMDDDSCLMTGVKLGETDDQRDEFANVGKKGTWSIRYAPSGIPNIFELRFPIPGMARSFFPTFTEEGDALKLVLPLPEFEHPVKLVRVSSPADEAEPAEVEAQVQ